MPYSLVTTHIFRRIKTCLVFVKYAVRNRQSAIPSVTPITGVKRFGILICRVYDVLTKKQGQ